MGGRSTIRPGDHRSDELVRHYLADVGCFALLTADEEVELARTIEAGRDAATALEASPQPSPARRRQLRQAVLAGDRARRRFVECNLRLVVSVAKRYRHAGLPMLDLIQEGNLGLMRAVEKFDYRKGFKFSTYATWWIRQSITRAIADKSRTIRVPAHLGDRLSIIRRSSSNLLKALGREPTAAELAADTGIPAEKVVDALRHQPDLVSLSTPVGEDDTELADLVPDVLAAAPADEAVNKLSSTQLWASLDRLTPAERDVVMLRFGLGESRPMTLEEVGTRFSLTRERIRQIEAKALTKLRHPCLPGHLRTLVETT